MSRRTDTATHVPPFAKPLAPYLKSRQEALRIRQALTLYLRSQIIFADDDSTNPGCHLQSHLSLCEPHDAVVGVKRVPPELTGLRKEYLKALQANVAARKEYDAIAEEVASRRVKSEADVGGDTAASGGASSELQTYIALLRDRRRHEKLKLFQHYLNELNGRDAAKPDYLHIAHDRDRELPAPHEFEAQIENESQDLGGTGQGLEELVHKLEKAVIRAKGQLDREKKLFEELKARRESSEDKQNGDASPALRAMALQRTRNELVQWVEEKLVTSGGDEKSPLQELSQDEMDDISQSIEDRKAQIREQYAAYLDARKALLDTVSVMSQPATNQSTKVRPQSMCEDKKTVPSSDLDVVDVLPYASEVLFPLSKSQKALAIQKTYLSGILVKEKSTTRRILDRLSDESHLLPEYPILARQPRFKHAVAAISSRTPTAGSEQNKTDEVVARAQAWAFASGAARMNEREYVEEKTAIGTEMAGSAKETLKEVYDILNQDYDGVMGGDDEDKQDDRDIWASEVRSTRYRGRQARAEKRTKGPWSGLNGRVGVVGDA
ncbi:hypothetical protein VTN00DRAFT_2834 [Thermoascus crustaceus]|uniref:uncharacterized protein n=1 Tax=Thermoascus crustaceus TaxID=5088 RepID=UPI0037420E81